MYEATGRMDLNMFAQTINLTSTQIIILMQELVYEGFLRRVGNGYSLTEKGKNAQKLALTYPSEKAFHFYIDLEKPLNVSSASLEEFYLQIRQISLDSLEFHFYRGDFENWVRQVLDDCALAQKLTSLKTDGLHGEEMRNALLKAFDNRYGVSELI
jgi:hypothetical protein